MSDLHTEQATVPPSAERTKRKDWIEPNLEVLPLSETEASTGSGPDGGTGS